MGQNSKAKRDAKAKARHRAQRSVQSGPAVTHVQLLDDVTAPPGDSRELARMLRRECSECGSTDLEWMTPEEFATRGDEERRARVAEIVGFVGGGANAWTCPRCGNFGIL